MNDKTVIVSDSAGGISALPTEYELEHYTIKHVLGAGGFGITYRAEHKGLGKQFAIKEYFPESFAVREQSVVRATTSGKQDYEWGLKRFLEEARMLARFEHPAIVGVHHIFEEKGTAYLVLEYVEGQSLGSWLKELGRAPTQSELDDILAPLLDGLSLVHAEGFLHRDIAPDNIYMRSDGSPVLLDFGSAREAMGKRSKLVSAIVKSGYSPPEQYTTDAEAQGAWTDLYALAATLYHAISGNPPQEATSRQLTDRLTSALEVGKDEYRETFLKAIDWALALRPEERPQSIAEWRAALLDGEDGSATTQRFAGTGGAKPSAPPPPRIQTDLSVDFPYAAILAAGFAVLAVIGAIIWFVTSGEDTQRVVTTTTPPPEENNDGSTKPTRRGETTTTTTTTTQEQPPVSLNWTSYKNPRFGFTVEYPDNILQPNPESVNGDGRTFVSQDNNTLLTVRGQHNGENVTPAAYLKELTEGFPEYRGADIFRQSENGFIITGTRAWKEYGLVVLFGCNNTIINSLEFELPLTLGEQQTYQDIFSRMVRNFQTGKGADTAANCPSEKLVTTTPAQPTQQTAARIDQTLNAARGFSWSSGTLQQGIWGASVQNANGSSLLINCDIAGGNPGSGLVRFQIKKPGVKTANAAYNTKFLIDELIDAASFDVSAGNGSARIQRLHPRQDQGIGWLKSVVGLVSVANFVTVEVPELEIKQSFSLAGASRALSRCLTGPTIANK